MSSTHTNNRRRRRGLDSWQLARKQNQPSSDLVPTIEKIEQSLNRWNKTHPALEGCKKIVQIVVGGSTQYLTAVQEMLKETEEYPVFVLKALGGGLENPKALAKPKALTPGRCQGLGLVFPRISGRNKIRNFHPSLGTIFIV
ncbi:hypothetical protein B0H19DRAFT_1077331 [Mycena capillaripes]|nr:hypothetical protein B0H19DRAFT_1077331 [Mycena capillaripes]